MFDAFRTLALCLAAMTGMVEDMTPDPKRMKAAAGAGYAIATDLADWLVQALKMPFREAHHITGRIVALAAERGVALERLTLEEMQSVEPRITRRRVRRAGRRPLGQEPHVLRRNRAGQRAPPGARLVEAARERGEARLSARRARGRRNGGNRRSGADRRQDQGHADQRRAEARAAHGARSGRRVVRISGGQPGSRQERLEPPRRRKRRLELARGRTLDLVDRRPRHICRFVASAAACGATASARGSIHGAAAAACRLRQWPTTTMRSGDAARRPLRKRLTFALGSSRLVEIPPTIRSTPSAASRRSWRGRPRPRREARGG